LISLVALVFFTGLVDTIRNGISATHYVVPTPTTLILPSATPTIPPTSTLTPTLLPSATLSPTPTPEPTPAYALVTAASQYGGANLRVDPGGALIEVLANGLMVEVLPETTSVGSVIWAHVRTLDGTEGWVLQSVLIATTRVPLPTITPTP
jgi:hypothetical protein